MIFDKIQDTILSVDTSKISPLRKELLDKLVNYIQGKVDQNQTVGLNFICTHNSRRSHLCQVWAQTLAAHFNIKSVFCYSAGTEATAMFPVIASTLKKSGFVISKLSESQNSVYSIKYAENEHPVIGFSKKLDSQFNPSSEFAAIMTCSQADQACPLVPGAESRISLPFEDPKVFDKSPLQEEKYEERSLEIASEMFYVFSAIQHHG